MLAVRGRATVAAEEYLPSGADALYDERRNLRNRRAKFVRRGKFSRD